MHLYAFELTKFNELFFSVHLLACFSEVGGNQRTWFKPTQTWGEHGKKLFHAAPDQLSTGKIIQNPIKSLSSAFSNGV